ncbi:DUF2634 domain-containing protein [Bacillus sp. RG28]|uniref:DUF2634 domain-containing protein n=1 Tax=Gottfriedia endophytica TaxID=2820819 RepID=A0A940NQ61_9BACI|nr:DUF2634 domain-containing protein [Gottfriedia endophytica]MBP0725528.1 DUF2634 domain-containing protein [Gottfriedia endophytica]
MSIFPFTEDIQQDDSLTLPLAREWAWNYINNTFDLKNGKMYIVEGLEAVKVWAYKALKTERFRFSSYDDEYGVEYEGLIGSGFTLDVIESEVKRLSEEALLINAYIISIDNVEVTSINDKVTANITINTLYGVVTVNGN